MSPSPDYNAQETTGYDIRFRPLDQPAAPRHGARRKTRKSSAPKSFNGIHRRRSKRMAW